MTNNSDTCDRAKLRLSPETLVVFDAARSSRLGKDSRNTWITEAIHKLLAREEVANDQLESRRQGNG